MVIKSRRVIAKREKEGLKTLRLLLQNKKIQPVSVHNINTRIDTYLACQALPFLKQSEVISVVTIYDYLAGLAHLSL